MFESESAAPAAAEQSVAIESAVSSEPIGADDLAGLFRAELEAEDAAQNASPAPVEAAATPDPADSVAAEPEGIEQEGEPAEPDPASPALPAPAGMSEADRAVFAKLPPDAQAWIVKRETEARADYTKKTQAVAEMRKATEAQQAKVMEQLQQYDQILSQFTTRQLQPPDPALRMTDPDAYEHQVAVYLQSKHQQDIAIAEQQRVRAEQQAAIEASQKQYWADQANQLRELAPELGSNDAKGAEARRAVYAYASELGYSKEQLSQASALDMVTLWKAQRYDAAMKAKAQAKPVVQPAPKVMAPGPAKAGGRNGGMAAAVRNLSENPTRAGLAAAYLAELAAER